MASFHFQAVLVLGAAVMMLSQASGASSSSAALLANIRINQLSGNLGVDASKDAIITWHIDADQSERGVVQKGVAIELRRLSLGGDKVVVMNAPAIATVNKTIRISAEQLDAASTYEVYLAVTLSDESVVTATSTFGTAIDSWGDAVWITGGNILRAEFDAPASVSNATLSIAGIGYYEAFLNGKRAGGDDARKLDTAWTDYTKRVYFQTFDVSGELQKGAKNALAVSLGNGWFSCGSKDAPTTQPGCIDAPTQLIALLSIDGKSAVWTGENGWEAAAGPITYDSLYNGESYDGVRAETLRGWKQAGFADAASAFKPATAASSPANSATLTSQEFAPIRRLATFSPRTVTSPANGFQVFDFGQNMAGVVELRNLRCKRGQNITIRHAELLTHPPYGPVDGSIYVGNLRGAKATDVFTCSGISPETYTPTFTQHGFRYAEVSGLGYPLAFEDISAVELHTDVTEHSSITFSDSLLNLMQHAVVWGQKSNLMSVPTDCDNRDERRGWSGDAALTAEEAFYNFDMNAFYHHWLDMIQDDQQSSGAVTNFVPNLGTGAGAPNWQTVYPSIIYAMWEYGGDANVVEAHFASLEKYFDYWEGLYNTTGMGKFATGFGDWVPPPPSPKADGHLTGAFAFLNDLRMGTQFFGAIPKGAARAARCASLLDRAAKDFHATFYNAAAGYYGSGLQSEQAFPLYLGIVPADVLPRVLNYTINDIMVTNKVHTTSGIVGWKTMLEALTANGRTDVALAMLQQTSYPSIGYMLQNAYEPATTIWELWDSDKEGPGMNSRNHIMFGTMGSYFYKCLAGVTPASPGYATASVSPKGVEYLERVDAMVSTPHGPLEASYSFDGNTTTLTQRVVTPVTTMVDVPVLSAGGVKTVKEGDVIVWQGGKFTPAAGVLKAEMLADALRITVSAGGYSFTSTFS